MSRASDALKRIGSRVRQLDEAVAHAAGPGSGFDRSTRALAMRTVGWFRSRASGMLAAAPAGSVADRAAHRLGSLGAAIARAARQVLRTAAGDPTGLVAGALIFVAAWLTVAALWDMLATPPRLINGLVATVTPRTCAPFGRGGLSDTACGLVLGLLTVVGALVAMALGVLVRVPLRGILATVFGWLPREAGFLGSPLLATALFTMGWAGVQFHARERPGLVSDGTFPAVFGVATYALARTWPALSGRAGSLLALRAAFAPRLKWILVAGAPIAISIVGTYLWNPPVRDQIVALVGLVVGFVLLTPAPGSRAPRVGGYPSTGATAAVAALTGATVWLALSNAVAAAGPCAEAFVLDARACEAAHHGPLVGAVGALVGLLAALGGTAGAGVTTGEALTAAAAPPASATRGPTSLVDQYGETLIPDAEGMVEIVDWDQAGTPWIRVTAAEAAEKLDRFRAMRAAEGADQDRFREVSRAEAEADWAVRGEAIDAQRAVAEATMLAEIRADRARLEGFADYLRQRGALEEGLVASQAEQAEQEGWDAWLEGVKDDAFDGMLRDVDSLPEFAQDVGVATRRVIGNTVEALSDPDNWRVVAEAAAETAYDAAGLAAGGAFGSGADKAAASFHDAAEFGAKVAEAVAKDPVGFVKQLTPLADLEASMDPNVPLGERLVHLGVALIDVGTTLSGAGALRAADAVDGLADAARLAEALDEARDAARLAGRADDVFDTARAAAAADEAFTARTGAWREAQEQGRRAVDEFKGLVDEGVDAREAVLRLQGNKQALQAIKGESAAVREAFNREMQAIYRQTDDHVLSQVLRREGFVDVQRVPVDPSNPSLQVFREVGADGAPTGREIQFFSPTNPPKIGPDGLPVIKVGADRDFTVYVRGGPGATPVSLPHDEVRSWYRDGFWDATGGEQMAGRLGLAPAGSGPEAIVAAKESLLRRLDQAVTSDVHPEAYRNVNAVLTQPHAAIGDVQQVGLATGYKADHLFGFAEELRLTNAAAAEDWMAEGARQLTKQFDNQVAPRYEALTQQVEFLRSTGQLPADYALRSMPPNLTAAIETMRQVEQGAMSPAEMERALRELGMTPRDVSSQVGGYLEAMEKLRPSPVRDLQSALAQVGRTGK